MDGALKKELKKLDEHNFENIINFGKYGRYTTDGSRATSEEKFRRVHFQNDKSSVIDDITGWRKNLRDWVGKFRASSLRMILSDWVFLAVLGVVVALISASIDTITYYLQEVQQWTVQFLDASKFWGFAITYSAFVIYLTFMVVMSTTLVHWISPQAIGSGIPEMKTIIRGVILKDYLTFRTLVSKIVGLPFSLGSGIHIGKMGPFVHIASVVANQLSLLAARYDPAFGSETRRLETLSAACAVGVACCFSAPIGGVLFSIEVTTMYFSVRNYWRGFFASCCGAFVIRLISGIFAKTEVTTQAFYQTNFPKDAFTVDEMPLFVLLGVICGVLGALYVWLYKTLVLFLRENKGAKKIFQQHWIVYPIVVSFILASIIYPFGLGQYITGRIRFSRNLKDFFLNCTFSEPVGSPLSCGSELYRHWTGTKIEAMNSLTLLACFIVTLFATSIVSVSLPVPSGIFMPVFVLGAGMGRLMGEIVAIMKPHGFGEGLHVMPGVYAVVGSAAFSGAVTHSVSSAVIVFEATGQLHLILPVMTAIIIANAVCTYLQPSFFDTIIKIKHLPFLPDIPPSSNVVHTICAENIMISPVMFITRMCSYESIRKTLVDCTALRIFPVVDNAESQMLIGTVSRRCLLEVLEAQVGDSARKFEAEKRVRQAIETIDMHFKKTQNEIGSACQRNMSEYNLTKHMNDELIPPRRVMSESMNFLDVDHLTSSSNKKRQSNNGDSNSYTKNRFTVIPAPETKTAVSSPEPVTPKKTSPVSRRNACFSIDDNIEKTFEAIDDSGTIGNSSIHSHHSSKHLTLHSFHVEYQNFVKNYLKQARKYMEMLKGNKKKDNGNFSIYDLTGMERNLWESNRLQETFTFAEELIDPAPFQLVKKTSLYRIHSIFSMLQLSKAYVTDCGRLIGVVALSDVRRALERSEGERAAEIPNASEDIEAVSHTATHEGLKKKKSAMIHDVLTPTLEVICPHAVLLAGGAGIGKDGNYSWTITNSTLKYPSASKAEDEKQELYRARPRFTTDAEEKEECAEELVEAVAYLRKQSLKQEIRRRSDI